MRVLPKFVSMERTPEEVQEGMTPSFTAANKFPYGLCIRLSQEELDKLDLDTNVDTGDMIHLHALGKVTSVSKRDTEGGQECCVEIQLTDIALEEEDHENEEADAETAEAKIGKRYDQED